MPRSERGDKSTQKTMSIVMTDQTVSTRGLLVDERVSMWCLRVFTSGPEGVSRTQEQRWDETLDRSNIERPSSRQPDSTTLTDFTDFVMLSGVVSKEKEKKIPFFTVKTLIMV